MRRTAGMLAIGTVCVLLGGCGSYRAPVVPPVALIYSNVKAPMDTDMDAQPLGAKTGRASTEQILSLFAWGDASIQAAAANGNITKINHADYHYKNILGVYSKFTTVVTGD